MGSLYPRRGLHKECFTVALSQVFPFSPPFSWNLFPLLYVFVVLRPLCLVLWDLRSHPVRLTGWNPTSDSRYPLTTSSSSLYNSKRCPSLNVSPLFSVWGGAVWGSFLETGPSKTFRVKDGYLTPSTTNFLCSSLPLVYFPVDFYKIQ